MSAVASHGTALLVPAFPAAVEAQRETERRLVWNGREHTSEDRELVYEISWIAKLVFRRRFLRSQPKLRS
jgi:hypothetical protein